MKQPKTVSEHIIALYGQVKGLKSAICSIRTNDLKHMHGDIDRLHNKIDRLLWWIIGGLGATLLTIITVLIQEETIMEKIKELYKLAKEHKKISIAIGVVILVIILTNI